MMSSRFRVTAVAVAALLALAQRAHAQGALAPGEARALAREAYVYGFPLVDSYRIVHAAFVDSASPEYSAPFNTLNNIPRVSAPKDRKAQTPDSETLYSMLGMDLRAEPLVLTVPPMEKNRYFSVQLVDAYTFNFDYIGSRATGNDGGSFLVAGPGWKGDAPKGIRKVIRSETNLALAVYRTQLLGPGDLDTAKKLRAALKAQPLSAFLGQPAPAPAPQIVFFKPLTPAEQKTSPEFFNILNFVLQFCPTHPAEQGLMDRFARIGVGAGRRLDAGRLPPEVRQAIVDGMADAWKDQEAFERTSLATGKVTSGDLFGSREALKDNYLYRFAGAVLGIYGNSREEAQYLADRLGAVGPAPAPQRLR